MGESGADTTGNNSWNGSVAVREGKGEGTADGGRRTADEAEGGATAAARAKRNTRRKNKERRVL